MLEFSKSQSNLVALAISGGLFLSEIISTRILTIQLKELEKHELISKVIYPVVPPKVEYSLTEFGKTLIPVISALGYWGDKNEERLRNVILKRSES